MWISLLLMSIKLSVSNLSHSLGGRQLFANLNFSINLGDRIALIGPNGAGKSTLLKILDKQFNAETGSVTYSQDTKLSLLSQNPEFDENKTIYEVISEATGDAYESANISYTFELISKLNFSKANTEYADAENIPVKTLSGGWRKKLAIAQALACKPNLLLLDEPTNHLDIQSIIWLENFLNTLNEISIVCVTHDRLFLQNTCEVVFDLDKRNPNGLLQFKGSYADFAEIKLSRINELASIEEKKKNTMRRETAWLRRGAKARQTKQKARIERAGDLESEIKTLEEIRQHKISSFQFGDEFRNPKKVIEATNVSGGYSLNKNSHERSLFQNFNYTLRGRSRVGIIGPNGCGKSTMIKTLLGEISPLSGSVKTADGLRVAYFEQNKNVFNESLSVMKNICPEGDYVKLQGNFVFAKSYLSRFNFRPEQMDLPVERLSGGEKSRLLLASLMLKSESILVLDEPTNDLDVDTLDTLADALNEYQGAVILVTHDRFFMDQVVDEILAFTDSGEIIKFADYFQWDEWNKSKKIPFDESKFANSNDMKSESENVKQKVKLTFKEKYELENIEATILSAEEKLQQIKEKVHNIQSTPDYKKLLELTIELEKQQALIGSLYERWSELNEKAESTK